MTEDIQVLFDAGAHVGYSRTRRHPSALPFLFGTKDRLDVFDLEKTKKHLETAEAYIEEVARGGKQLLFVGGKPESSALVRAAAERAYMPYVASRWIGGTLTNFKNIRKRIERFVDLSGKRESGELGKYTKRERLLMDRETEELKARFGGIVSMEEIPAAVFIVDTEYEKTATREANQLGIPVIALASSDCDFSLVQYPIPANDTSVKSVKLIVERIADAYLKGKKTRESGKPEARNSKSKAHSK